MARVLRRVPGRRTGRVHRRRRTGSGRRAGPAGGGEPGSAGQVRVVGDVGEPAVRAQQRRAPPSPCVSSCSMPSAPPGRSSAAARASTGRITARPSGPPKTASAGSCAATSGGTPAPSGTYGGLQSSTSTRPASSASRLRLRRRHRRPPRSAGRPPPARSAALRRSQASAGADRSTANTRAPGTSWATASAIAPGPLHRSTTSRPGGRRPGGRAGSPASSAPPARHDRPDGPGDAPAGQQLGLRAGHEDTRARPPAPGAGTPPCRAGAATARARDRRVDEFRSRASCPAVSGVGQGQPTAAAPRARTPPAAPPRSGPDRPRRRPASVAREPAATDGRIRPVPSAGCCGNTRHDIIMKRRPGIIVLRVRFRSGSAGRANRSGDRNGRSAGSTGPL